MGHIKHRGAISTNNQRILQLVREKHRGRNIYQQSLGGYSPATLTRSRKSRTSHIRSYKSKRKRTCSTGTDRQRYYVTCMCSLMHIVAGQYLTKVSQQLFSHRARCKYAHPLLPSPRLARNCAPPDGPWWCLENVESVTSHTFSFRP